MLLLPATSLWAQTPGAVSLDGNGNPAAGFNYSARYVSVADDAALDLVGDFTIEMWFNPHEYGGFAHPWEGFYPNDWKALISKGSWITANGPGEFTILLHPGAGFLNFYIDGGAHSAAFGQLTLDRWYHMALVRESNWVQFYLDGAPVGAPGWVPQNAINTRDLWIGKSMGSNKYPGSGVMSHEYAFGGLIDEVRIWNVARTQQQVQDGVNSQLCDDRTGLVAYFQFENGSLDSSVGTFSGVAHNGLETGSGVAVAACDSDGDGFTDDVDLFPSSNVSPTVVIGTCDSAVPNHQAGAGANLMDLIGAAADAAGNHGSFVRTVTQLASGWQRSGLISGRQKGQITSCAARSSIGK